VQKLLVANSMTNRIMSKDATTYHHEGVQYVMQGKLEGGI